MYGTEYGVENIQHQILDVLKCIDKVCKENGIQYSLHGGTLLGAVREKGFIPWDDDADVSMTRENFKRFEAVFNEAQDTYVMACNDVWVSRISPKVQQESDDEICVDIFIYDYVSERALARELKIFFLRMMQGMLKTDIAWEKYHGFSKLLTAVTYALGKPFSRNRKLKWYNHISEYWFCGSRKLIFRADDPFSLLRIIYPKELMEEYIEIEFEDAVFSILARYDEELKSVYGEDYMTPPAKNKRVPTYKGWVKG